MSARLLLRPCSTALTSSSISIAEKSSTVPLMQATMLNLKGTSRGRNRKWKTAKQQISWASSPVVVTSAALQQQQPLDLTEENVRKVLGEARGELAQLFDQSVGITGKAELAELDGPFVKIRLMGRFWHKRSTVLERLSNYLCQRIPEILEVDIEDEKQLDDSPENF